MPLINPLMIAAALCLVAISIALPVAQWAAIPTTPAEQILTGAAALGLMLCKLALFPLGFAHASARRTLAASVCLSFAVLLLIISIDASRDFLNASAAARKTQNASGDVVSQRLNTSADQLTLQIEALVLVTQLDSANGYRQRAVDTAATVQGLRETLAETVAAIDARAQASPRAGGDDYGVGLSVDDATDRSALAGLLSPALVIAFCIHVGCVIAIMACGAWAMPRASVTPITPDNKRPANAPPPPALTEKHKAQILAAIEKDKRNAGRVKHPDPVIIDTPALTWFDLSEAQKNLAHDITAGLFSSIPRMRDLIKAGAIPGGFKTIKPVFAYLFDHGFLIKQGRGYALTQQSLFDADARPEKTDPITPTAKKDA